MTTRASLRNVAKRQRTQEARKPAPPPAAASAPPQLQDEPEEEIAIIGSESLEERLVRISREEASGELVCIVDDSNDEGPTLARQSPAAEAAAATAVSSCGEIQGASGGRAEAPGDGVCVPEHLRAAKGTPVKKGGVRGWSLEDDPRRNCPGLLSA